MPVGLERAGARAYRIRFVPWIPRFITLPFPPLHPPIASDKTGHTPRSLRTVDHRVGRAPHARVDLQHGSGDRVELAWEGWWEANLISARNRLHTHLVCIFSSTLIVDTHTSTGVPV